MQDTICGLDCSQCWLQTECGGCQKTQGRPFGKECMIAVCCQKKGRDQCSGCDECRLKKDLLAEFSSLGIEELQQINTLYALKGALINGAYPLPSGQKIQIWDDNKIYLGNQVEKKNSDRCYGLAADEKYLMVAEYGENGSNAELVVFRRRDRKSD